VNVSDKDFTPVYVDEEAPKGKRKAAPKKVGVIRFGTMAVRGVGEKAVESVIAERQAKGEFTSIFDFCERVDLRTMTRSTIEALVKCGAFASISPTRAPLLAVLENAVEAGQQIQNDKRSGQMAMFGTAPTATGPRQTNVALPDVEEFKPAELLKFEKDLLGFYITSHPLNEHQAAMDRYTTDTTREAMNRSEGSEVTIGGMISRVKKVITKNGRSAGMPMAIITLEDLEGQIDATAFAETYAEICQKYPTAVANESIVFVRGKIDRKRETPSILINEVIPIEDAVNRLTTGVILKLDPAKHSADTLAEIKPLLQKYKGNSEVYCQVPSTAGLVSIRLDRSVGVKPSKDMEDDLQMKLGNECVQLLGAGTKRAKMRQQKLFQAEEVAAAETAPIMGEDAAMAAMDAEMAEA
jgi:DNA polymerase-3 subunit alpha